MVNTGIATVGHALIGADKRTHATQETKLCLQNIILGMKGVQVRDLEVIGEFGARRQQKMSQTSHLNKSK